MTTRVAAVVVVAMPDEAAPFLALADSARPTRHAGVAGHDLEVAGRAILLLQTGIGLVNAAGGLAAALQRVRPGAVVSAGTAGGLGAQVRVGDVVVGTRHVYPGADARAFGYALGQVPGMPAEYPGDAGLVAATTSPADRGTPTGRAARPDPPVRVLTGLVLSGDTFVDAGMVAPLRASFPDALSTDMESTALAQTSFTAGVPFVSVRGISDLCGPAAGADFLSHVDDAADRAAAVVERLLRGRSGGPAPSGS